MKSIIKISIFTLLIINSQNLTASHIMGADITYKLIDTANGKYRFTVNLYRDCAGINYGGEQLQIRKAGFSTSIPMTLIYKEEVTPMCRVPDVATSPTTNCPNGTSATIKGVEKWVFQVDYVLGKNIGYAYVGWTSCCRNAVINTIAAASASSIWVQAIINTNYVNNSPVFANTPVPYWCRLRQSTYSHGATDSFDSKTINVNGQAVLQDSLVYQLYAPHTGEATNPNQAAILGNPSVTFNSPLNQNDFIYTTSGVVVDSKTGTITATPAIVQDGIMAMAIKEYRAIPNASGIGYTRILVGYVCRDLQFTVRDVCDDISTSGLIKDSSTLDSIITTYTARSCRFKGNIIKLKLIGSPTQFLKIKDLSAIDTSSISNYNFSYNIIRAGNTDTMFITLNFDKKHSGGSSTFLFKTYYCNSSGYIIEKYLPITIFFSNSISGFETDTMFVCNSTLPTRITIPFTKNLKWTPASSIISAEPVDSSWVDVPTMNSKFYANNLASNPECKFNDSIVIKVDSCSSISGYLYLDLNGNCTKDSTDSIVANTSLQVSSPSSGYTSSIITDNLGYYFFAPPVNNSYLFSKNGLNFNCSSPSTVYSVSHGSTNTTANIPIKDKIKISNILFNTNYNSNCVNDSIDFYIFFNKTIGNGKTKVFFGDNDSLVFNLNISNGTVNNNFKHLYKTSDTFYPKIKWYSSSNNIVDSIYLPRVILSNCISGKVYADINSDCNYAFSQDTLLKTYKVIIRNTPSNQISKILFTNIKGEYRTPIAKNQAFNIEIADSINCNSGSSIISVPAFSNDTFITRNIPININSINYKLIVNRLGRVDNFGNLILYINGYSNFNFTNPTKTFIVTLPAKCTYLGSTSSNTTVTQAGNKLTVVNNGFFLSNLSFKFDSLVVSDTLCFHVKLLKVLNETDTSDNEMTICLPAFTSYDPNNKISAIKSSINQTDFTDKTNRIFYTINFQNTGKVPARDIYLTDSFENKLDLNSIEILKYSHPMTAAIDDNRKMVFDFKNIMLPDSASDPEGSKGYVSFSILPISSLVINDVIENNAKIYFDFNPYILTNTATNKYVQKSAPQDMSILYTSSELRIFPNPVKDKLSIESQNPVSKNEILIYNLEGKLINTYLNAKLIDFSSYQSGVYILHINTDKQKSQIKVIKN